MKTDTSLLDKTGHYPVYVYELMPKYRHPFLECDHHAGPQRGYIMCLHVRDQRAPVKHVRLATDQEIGEILCARRHHDNADELCIICEGCAIEHKFLIHE